MRSIRLNLNGSSKSSIDWNSTVEGVDGAAQRAAVNVMTELGSRTYDPTSGNSISSRLLGVGAFDALGVQHELNFGALKVRRDMRNNDDSRLPETDSVSVIKLTLLQLQDGAAETALDVGTDAGETTQTLTQLT